MAKKVNRKKQLRNILRRSGAFSSSVTKVLEDTTKVIKQTEKAAQEVGKAVSQKVEQVVKTTKEKVQKTTGSVEDFAESLGGLSLERAKIKSVADFKNWTEKELLTLKGIGPATIKKLKENGVRFK